MPLPPRLFAGDEELGKRDDDHRPHRRSPLTVSWPWWRGLFRFRRKRLFLLIVGFLLIYTLYRQLRSNINISDAPYDIASGPMLGNKTPAKWANVEPPEGQTPPVSAEAVRLEVEGTSKHYYNGLAKLYRLANTLAVLFKMKGNLEVNRNVLFAAANLKSAAVLIPMACEMARWRRSNVHFAVMGRDDLPLADLLEVNGIDKDCQVSWHDARPDYSQYSTDLRLEVSVQGAMYHINEFMHPQVVIIDGSGQEDKSFLSSLRSKLQEWSKPLIEIPYSGSETLMWMTRLDSGSLAAWHKAQIDIVIQAPSDSSGSLVKLLQSLDRADFFSTIPPRITIELPSAIDPPTRKYLEDFHWPPPARDGRPSINLLTVRHQITPAQTSPERASLRLLESFYPSNPSNSHILLLSPQTELSPLFYHYLKYSLLEYYYSAWTSAATKNIFGISLEVPLLHLNGTSTFVPPRTTSNTPFLWQAPNANAALYFGSSWVEFHDFLRRRLENPIPSTPPAYPQSKTHHPEWSSHLLSLLRTRGAYLLYPPFSPSTVSSSASPEDPGVVILHDELSHPSYPTRSKPPPRSEPPLLPPDPPLHLSLPFDADLPEIGAMPLLLPDGRPISAIDLEKASAAYAAAFRKEVGGCRAPTAQHAAAKPKPRKPGSTSDLFCDDDDDDEAEEQVVAKVVETPTSTSTTAVSSETSSTRAGVKAVNEPTETTEPILSATLI